MLMFVTETAVASKSNSEIPSSKVKGSSKKFEVSFEGVLNEAFQQRCKDLANQPSFDAFEQNSWRRSTKEEEVTVVQVQQIRVEDTSILITMFLRIDN
ncbi:hypothetical protein NC651_004869 [Populus alba x Populus x berolinensis]|nr:hypothetical protein NC651_004869 [Populus alba x Populus x berolinensis]